MLYGGLYASPLAGSEKGEGSEAGVSLLHVAAPLAMILEAAKGAAVTGSKATTKAPFKRVLCVSPKRPDERCSLYLGSPEDVAELGAFLERDGR